MTCHRSDIKAEIAASLISSADKNKPCIGGQGIMALTARITFASCSCTSAIPSTVSFKQTPLPKAQAVLPGLQRMTTAIGTATMLKKYFNHCFKANLCMFAIHNGALPTGLTDLLPIQQAIQKFMACAVV
ncbi:hypothetical protein BC835DRAFT_1307427 [Cytidiella melzeri]|nr:hypothetical protein BC835DRAFT_1307427 [Cytidiella melzeri]